MLLRAPTPDTLDALLAVAGPQGDAPLVSVEIRHLGGALARGGPDHGALATLDGDFVVFAVGVPFDPGMVSASGVGLQALHTALRPWEAGVGYPNFADQPTTTAQLLGGAVAARLRAVKAAHDPHDLFLSNHPVDAAR